jgi:hypothetical protein
MPRTAPSEPAAPGHPVLPHPPGAYPCAGAFTGGTATKEVAPGVFVSLAQAEGGGLELRRVRFDKQVRVVLAALS